MARAAREARILANPKNRLLLVTGDGLYAGHVLREDVPEGEPDEAPLLPHVRRDCPQTRLLATVLRPRFAGDRRVRTAR